MVPQAAYAQVGSVAGVVRDNSQAVLPGVTVEVTSPALIEKVRSTTTDGNGRYQIQALPVGTYTVSFSLTGFGTVRRQNVLVTSSTAVPVNADMRVGGITDEVTVTAESPLVDVVNAHQQLVFGGDEIADLPTQRDIPSILNLVPGMMTSSLRGTCNGGVGVFCNPTVPLFNSHTAVVDDPAVSSQNQGRIMVDGMSINMGRAGTGINENVGLANGIVLDTAGAQEVAFTLSGSLGESETGGASINIVPRTGGNRYSGSQSTTYTENRFFDRNRDSRLTWDPVNGERVSLPRNNFVMDYDITGAFGGPVVRDRLWFYLQGRMQNRETYPGGQDAGFRNLNEGVFAANYIPDRDPGACARSSKACDDEGVFTYVNEYKNASARLTLQATQKNKFNIYWDEQDACTNPCYGMISIINSPESYFTLMSRPNRLLQLSWTNPYTNRVLLEAGLSTVLTHQDQTKAREFTNPRTIPRICEGGSTIGRDDVASRHPVNSGRQQDTPAGGGAGDCGVFTYMGSGSLNDQFPGSTPNTLVNDDTYRSRASLSYITGSHNVKFGFEGAYFMEKVRNEVNDLRLSYHYNTPNTNPNTTTWNATTRTGNCLVGVQQGDQWACGNMTLGIGQGWADPTDVQNTTWLRPIPVGFEMNTGVASTDERVWFGALYLQDQWTINRFTLNGAVRYDHAESRYGASCIGPDIFVPRDADQPSGSWCSSPESGVRYNDITPRWGMAWDVFGTGKTSVKFNGGKFLQGAGFGGLYTNFNDARRSTNALTRRWDDTNGNRMVECDHTSPASHTTFGDYCGALTTGAGAPTNTFLQFGRPPGANALANPNSSCGLKNSPAEHVAYCLEAGQDLMRGWDVRRNEWQLGIGIQQEVLPRVSAELTYNRRIFGNITDGDTVGLGCDYYGVQADTLPASACLEGWQNYTDPSGIRDFFSFTAPSDPRLPDGGGYVIRGNTDRVETGFLPSGRGAVTLIRPERSYYWQGFDTNFVYRGPRGMRVSGGTSTGKNTNDTCDVTTDSPNVKGRVGNERAGGCISNEPWRTNIRANGSYTIPFVDVLAGVVFVYRPGVMRSANVTVPARYGAVDGTGRSNSFVTWDTNLVQDRSGLPFFTNTGTDEDLTVNLLDNFDLVGEGIRLTDLTFRKNFRFAGKRLTAGLDVYNLFNTDAATGYNNTYDAYVDDNGQWQIGRPQGGTNPRDFNDWGRVTGITNPRFMRFSMSFDF
jgi:hypothetical protein